MQGEPAAEEQDLDPRLVDALDQCIAGDTRALAALLSDPAQRRAAEALDGTPDALLPWAAAQGSAGAIELLLEAGG